MRSISIKVAIALSVVFSMSAGHVARGADDAGSITLSGVEIPLYEGARAVASCEDDYAKSLLAQDSADDIDLGFACVESTVKDAAAGDVAFYTPVFARQGFEQVFCAATMCAYFNRQTNMCLAMIGYFKDQKSRPAAELAADENAIVVYLFMVGEDPKCMS